VTGKLLTLVTVALAASGPAAAQTALDCDRATTTVEQRICDDGGLTRLDRRVAELWSKGLATWQPERMEKQNEAARRWAAGRDACDQAERVKACIESSYERRISELRIQIGEVSADRIVDFTCTSSSEPTLSAAFYPTEPAAAMVWWGTFEGILVATPASSGVRYIGEGVELWERRNETRATLGGVQFTCKAPA